MLDVQRVTCLSWYTQIVTIGEGSGSFCHTISTGECSGVQTITSNHHSIRYTFEAILVDTTILNCTFEQTIIEAIVVLYRLSNGLLFYVVCSNTVWVTRDKTESTWILASCRNDMALGKRARALLSFLASKRVFIWKVFVLIVSSLTDHFSQIKRFPANIPTWTLLAFAGPNFAGSDVGHSSYFCVHHINWVVETCIIGVLLG